jgi:UDP-N-acetylmuramate: L-alanyl-gamma-D-glutamyl-meso-diaminopimelate ligase
VANGKYCIVTDKQKYPLSILGKHNMENLEGARNVCNAIGIKDAQFYNAVSGFTGAAKRLEVLVEQEDRVVYRDFAHSPSKLKATTSAAKEQSPDRKLVAVMELHTYSSLSKEFLSEYKGAMDTADIAVVYYDEHAIALKRLPDVSVDDVLDGFKRKDLIVFTDKDKLATFLNEQNWNNSCLLLMSSGNFGGLDLEELIKTVTINV